MHKVGRLKRRNVLGELFFQEKIYFKREGNYSSKIPYYTSLIRDPSKHLTNFSNVVARPDPATPKASSWRESRGNLENLTKNLDASSELCLSSQSLDSGLTRETKGSAGILKKDFKKNSILFTLR